MTISIEDFVARLDGVKKAGAGFIARCPAHDDGAQSLSVQPGKIHPLLLRCFAGCTTMQVVDALGLHVSDLCTPKPGQRERSFSSKPFNPAPKPAAKPKPTVVREDEVAVTTYHLRDTAGKLVASKVRTDVLQHLSDGTTRPSKSFRWQLPDGSTGLGGFPVTRVPLFGSELLAKNPDAVVVLTEGAKAADALHRRGILGLGTDGASVVPAPEVLEALRGRRVVLCPDADAPGLAHMEAVAKALDGIAAALKVVEWPEGTPKGRDFADCTIEEIRALLAEAVPVEAKAEAVA